MAKRVLSWLGFVLLCNGAGFASAMVANEPAYYEQLSKPSWAPPGSVFGPVWTVLYTLMGTATWIVWKATSGPERRHAMSVFAIQLVLNVAWTPVFFGLHAPGPAVVVIAAVLAAVLVMVGAYARVSKPAAAMVVPLAVWVGFATVLNASIFARS